MLEYLIECITTSLITFLTGWISCFKENADSNKKDHQIEMSEYRKEVVEPLTTFKSLYNRL